MPFTINDVVTTTQTLTSTTDQGVITSMGALVGTSTCVSVTGGGLLVNNGLMSTVSFLVDAVANFSLMNNGLMTTQNTGLNINITGHTTTTTVIVNAGELVSTNGSAILCADSGLTIQNTGLISGQSAAILLPSSDMSATTLINNSGVIDNQSSGSTDYAIFCRGQARVVNTGAIFGDIDLGNGDDTLNNRGGMISGQIDLDDGDNQFWGGDLGETVQSGNGTDVLRGGGGDDYLESGFGHDTLRGGDGDDTLVADGDSDLMAGGAGRDVFVFDMSGISISAPPVNTVVDFTKGSDLIDLSALGLDIFEYVGNNPLAGGGQVSFGFQKSMGVITLLADVNGDRIADLRVDLVGAKPLTLLDFVL